MKKKIISVVICILMLISTAIIPATAETVEFDDVADNSWYKDAVYWCVERGYFSGTGIGKFSPEMTFSRAQIVRVLARVADADVSEYANEQRFSDVPVGEWYTAAVNWANDCGIVAGMSDGTFHPSDALTREQACVIFRAYLKYAKLTLPEVAKMKDYDDADNISSWAERAVQMAVKCGLMSGNDKNQLLPKDKCLRSMAVVMMKNFITSLDTATPKKDPFIVAYYNAERTILEEDVPNSDLAYVDVVNYHPFRVTYNTFPYIVDSLSDKVALVRQEAAALGNDDLKIVLTVANGNINTFENCFIPLDNAESFADALVSKVKTYDYDGIDIDYEFPQSAELRENFVHFMRHAREGLDKLSEETGKEYILSMAVPGSSWAWRLFDIGALKDIVSYFNLMNYDNHTGRGITLHHTSPYDNAVIEGGSVASDIAYYLENGVPAEKIVPGCGMYSHRWTEVEAGDDPNLPGLYQAGVHDADSVLSNIHFSTLYYSYINKKGFVRYWDDKAKAPYLYNARSKEFLSYDDTESVKYKVDLVKDYEVGGIMVFDFCTCDNVRIDSDGTTFFNYLNKIVKQ